VVIDDGSDPEVGKHIRAVCAGRADAEYRRHARNGGKGYAVICGLARARERGFSHAVQIDADGQHDLESLGALLEAARINPTAIVCGVPRFEQPIPLARRIGRPITNFWVAVNSLSLHIPDAMCGFRVYPVDETLNLAHQSVHGRRMDFDVEILVKAHWAGIPLTAVPVGVRYPDGNFSNFEVVRDNVLLSLLQTRLFLGMLRRLPRLVFRRRAKLRLPDTKPARWAAMKERGAYRGMRILAVIYRVLGRHICLAAMFPVVLYFFVTGREQRLASRDYLEHLRRSGRLANPPTRWLSFRHFLSFGESALDKLAAWTGNVPRTRLKGASLTLLKAVEASGHGAFVITAHIGNPEVIRAVASLGGRVPVNVLMHVEHAQLFNRLIREFAPELPVRAIAVSKVGVDTAVILSDAVSRGEWVVIAGDRSPVVENGRVVEVPFLGESAPFPQGPYILASLLKTPVFLLFCVRQGRDFHVHFSKFADAIELPRGDRVGAIRRYATRFAAALEKQVTETPLQWFNFYRFWNPVREGGEGAFEIRRAAK
jgi:predicted LPLAT superfamily acyltransferase